MRYLKSVMASLALLLLAALATVMMMQRNREIVTSIWIDRPPADIWRVLIDTDKYPTWNPMIFRVKGELHVGKVIEIDLGSSESDAQVFHPTVLVVQPNRELRWLGHVGLVGVFDGEHRFQLEASGTGTRFVQSERFSGWLVGHLTDSLLDDTLGQMKAMDLALKRRVEAVPR
jgi:hypothetical protein